MCLAIDFHEDFVQVPAPLGKGSQVRRPLLLDLTSEDWTETVPPEAYRAKHRAVADIEPALEEKVFELPRRQRITEVNHHREADHLGRAVEMAEGVAHSRRLWDVPLRLKPI